MIRNVIFDIGNVLVDFRWKEHMIELGFDDRCIERLTRYMVQHPLWEELDLGIRPHEEIISDMKALSPMYADEIGKYFEDTSRLIIPRTQAPMWLSSLKQRGINVYLLSNYPDWMFEEHSKDFGFLPYVDGMVISSHVHVIKPDEKIYLLLLEKYGLRAEECVFIDDRPENTQAAERLGIRPIVCRSQEQAAAELEQILG